MKLEATQKNKTLHEFYDPLNWSPPWRNRIERMLALVVYLENEIDYPSMLATHSHENLNLSAPCYNWVLSAPPSVDEGAPGCTIYEISCGLNMPWSHAVAYAATLEDVGEIVRAAIDGEVQISLNL
jgi:hypothetical protein